MSNQITIDELLIAFKEVERETSQGLTTTELCKVWGVKDTAVKTRIRLLKEQGLVTITKKHVIGNDGKSYPVVAYVVQEPENQE